MQRQDDGGIPTSLSLYLLSSKVGYKVMGRVRKTSAKHPGQHVSLKNIYLISEYSLLK